MNFIDEEYQKMISDIISDTFYTNSSIRGKLAGIRTYSEVLIRKILDIEPNNLVTLGSITYLPNRNQSNPYREKGIEKLGEDRFQDLVDIVDRIKPLGNQGTHTQRIEEFTEDELNSVIDAMFDLLAFFFIEYFLKYPMTMDTKAEVYRDFSLLPPIIRYKTLDYLFKHGETNVYVEDRLSLAIVKTYDRETALKWLYDNKEILEKDIYPSPEQYQIMLKQYFHFLVEENKTSLQNLVIENGIDRVNALVMREATKLTERRFEETPFKNSFELCLYKINKVSDFLQEKGKLYETFEQAIFYFQNQKNETNLPELTELHNIMEFVYLGRDSEKS